MKTVDVIRQMNIPLETWSYHSGAWTIFHEGTQKESISINPELENYEWILAHELGHATGAPWRLDRVAQKRYATQINTIFGIRIISRTCIRVEEAICDLVADALTLGSRKSRGYPKVVAGTRTAYYVQKKAEEAIDYILNVMDQREAA